MGLTRASAFWNTSAYFVGDMGSGLGVKALFLLMITHRHFSTSSSSSFSFASKVGGDTFLVLFFSWDWDRHWDQARGMRSLCFGEGHLPGLGNPPNYTSRLPHNKPYHKTATKAFKFFLPFLNPTKNKGNTHGPIISQ